MKILEYNDVDPLQVLYVNMLALDHALTPEKVARIRQSDPRPFPCLAVYAVEDGAVLGQVGIFRLPMISTEGREDVGGIWAVSTHPHYSGRGVASLLLDEAHARMREVGLRFSTLGTGRYRVAYSLYRQHGYNETNVLATALAPWSVAHQPTRLRLQAPGDYDSVEQVFNEIAPSYLGFAWRPTPFEPLRNISLGDIWMLMENNHRVGYAIAHVEDGMLAISNLLLHSGIDAAEAVAALSAELRAAYVQVSISRLSERTSLQGAGYHVVNPTWGSFMIKPLIPGVTVEDARHLYGIGTDRFLISWLDVT